ncbi:hypothetical protein A3841_08335 [Pontibacter flavimaris]|uniref:Uncharacterized protein n=1 Tax=Pontibacter flavimaris TaxID=1797110 RepID=A0A1Q5PIJ3_9BACT|nr:hypothetical protein A3841_08335 [Pontibacter flavimaris]
MVDDLLRYSGLNMDLSHISFHGGRKLLKAVLFIHSGAKVQLYPALLPKYLSVASTFLPKNFRSLHKL